MEEEKNMIDGVEPAQFSQREMCICINSILKSSDFYKAMEQEERGQLILFLKEKYFPKLTNEEVREIEAGIIDLSHNKITLDLLKAASHLPISHIKQGVGIMERLLGKEKAEQITKQLQDHHDKEYI